MMIIYNQLQLVYVYFNKFHLNLIWNLACRQSKNEQRKGEQLGSELASLKRSTSDEISRLERSVQLARDDLAERSAELTAAQEQLARTKERVKKAEDEYDRAHESELEAVQEVGCLIRLFVIVSRGAVKKCWDVSILGSLIFRRFSGFFI